MNSTQHAISVLSASLANSVQRALHAQRVYTETLDEQNVRNGAATGFVDLDGEGESVIEITFPVRFLEKPLFTPGLELGENTWLRYGQFPDWSATIGGWTTVPSDGDPIYTGALIGVVVTGAQKSILHYRFEGQSYTNPTGNSLSLGDL